MSTWMDEELAACRAAMERGKQAHRDEVAAECRTALAELHQRAVSAGTPEEYQEAMAQAGQVRQAAEDATAGGSQTLDALWESSRRNRWAEQEQRRQSKAAFLQLEAERRQREWEQTAGDPRAIAELVARRHGGLW